MALSAILAAAGLGTARAEPAEFVPAYGPPIGEIRYVTSIQTTDDAPDVDDYVGSLVAGESLTATASASRRSHLRPKLQLFAPDGTEVTPSTRSTRRGGATSFRGFVVPTTGRWTVRVSGAGSTEGDYAVVFAVKAAPPQVVRGRRLGDDQPLFATETFHAVDDALLDLKLVWTKNSAPVELKSLVDPTGAEVLRADGKNAVESVVSDRKRRSVSLSKVPLHTGDGDYAVRARINQGAATYDATFSVTPRRPKGRKPVVLSAVEPTLDALQSPLRGRPGFALALHGRNFSTTTLPRVRFGAVEGTVTGVASDGKSLSVVVPPGVAGATVPVAVANPDGQAATRPSYFTYLLPIVVTDLVDDSGAAVRAVSAEGGRTLHLVGEHFDSSARFALGGVAGGVAAVPSASEMLVTTPAAPAGDARVVVTDSFGGIATSAFLVRLKAPPNFDFFPYTPSVGAVDTPVVVTIKGRDFLADDQLSFRGAPVESTFVDSKTRTFSVPALPAGDYQVALTDDIGTVKRGPDFTVKPAPAISSVSIVAGPHVGANGIAVSGGTTVQVDGSFFHASDVVTLGGAQVSFKTHTPTRFTFDAPAGSLGPATLSVLDGANQGATLSDALRYVGYAEATLPRAPGASTLDNLVGDRAALGDLDGDGGADDLVLVSSYYGYGYNSGTRTEMTRVFLGGASHKLVDVTSTNFPATGTDASGVDNWNASAVAIGDVDRANGVDIVISGYAPYSFTGTSSYKSVRMFKNGGAGTFTQDEMITPNSAYAPAVYAVNATGTQFPVYGAVFEQGRARAVALGDLDGDTWPDLVVGRDHYDYRYVGIDPTNVNFTTTPPSVTTVAYLSYFQYGAGTKIYKNDLANGNGFVERTATAMPSAGASNVPIVPCFQTKDLALGDVDGQNGLDIVETWDDPTTVSAYGTYVGAGLDQPRVATRVLLNDGAGNFSDATTTWMPAAVAPEHWQGNRLALGDLDNDGKLDLVLLHVQGTDAYTTTGPAFGSTALRVLRNTGAAFVDATATAIPPLPSTGDNFRGDALAVRDVDGDGFADIVVGTTEALADGAGVPIRCTRLLRGGTNLVFTLDSAFLPATSTDTGEASDLVLGDLSGGLDPSLILVTKSTPQASVNGENLRIFDWKR
jgi:hypothetical protein